MPLECEGCKKKASYKKKGGKIRFCAECAPTNYIRDRRKQCLGKNCGTRASFGDSISREPLYCNEHKRIGDINLLGKRCHCGKRPSYKSTETEEVFCSSHKKGNTVRLIYNACCHPDCNDKCGNFANSKDDPERFCKTHKSPSMIDVVTAKCEDCGLVKPYYNYPGEASGRFCAKCQLSGMINVVSKTCEYLGCSSQPFFGIPGTKTGRFCAKHKSDDMVNVKHRKCICGKNATCKDENGIISLCMADAKKKGLSANIEGIKKCEICNERQANFNFPGKRAIRCSKDKEEGMVNVKQKKCDKCDRSASFGFLFNKPSRCIKHKYGNMVPRTKIYPKCLEELEDGKQCKQKAYYCTPDQSHPTKCENHAKKEDLNMVEKKCNSCGLDFLMVENRELCNECWDFVHSDKIKKSKELRIRDVLKSAKIKCASHDKSVEFGCSGRRPDFLIDVESFFIVLEVDENQHRHIPCDCEIGRMVQLHQDFGGIPLVFIRYNPDDYVNSVGEKVKGGRKNSNREKHLVWLIKKIIEVKSQTGVPFLSIYHLYFDGWNGKDVQVVLDYWEHSVRELADDLMGKITLD